jgi:hypothetical protein
MHHTNAIALMGRPHLPKLKEAFGMVSGKYILRQRIEQIENM